MEKLKLYKLLRDIRNEADITQSELGKKLNEPQSYVSKYENGERRLDLIEIEAVCNATGIGLKEFIRRYLES